MHSTAGHRRFLAFSLFLHASDILLDDAHLDVHHLLNLIGYVQSTPAAPPLERIGGIGDVLQLVQDELRQDERPLQEPRLAEIGYPAVDDDAGIENLVAGRSATPCFDRTWLAKDACCCENFDAVDEAEIGKDREKQEAEDRSEFKGRDRGLQGPGGQARQEQAAREACRAAQDRAGLRPPQRVFDPHGHTGDDHADRHPPDPTVLLSTRKQGKTKHDAENDERRTEHHTATPFHSWLIIPQAMPKQYTEEGKHLGGTARPRRGTAHPRRGTARRAPTNNG